MEESNKAVKGGQPTGNQKGPKKETTDPYMNKTPVVGKARPRTPAASGTKTVPKTSSVPSSKSRSNKLGSPVPKGSKSGNKPSGNQNPAASGNTDDTTKKVMVSEVSDEVVPIESALNKETEPTGKEVPTVGLRDEYVQSVAKQLTEGVENAQPQEEDDQDQKKGKKKDKQEKTLKKLEKKSLKAEKKVDKLMDKYKLARKENVKRGKLKNIKDKLLKAFAKLRRRHRKLRNAKA